jgi:hypothetical protein
MQSETLPRATFYNQQTTANPVETTLLYDPRDVAFCSVNSPKHYTAGQFESIDVIEDAVQFAPNAPQGALQWQVLKYILRMWHKGKSLEDAKKARWYLTRLINILENGNA